MPIITLVQPLLIENLISSSAAVLVEEKCCELSFKFVVFQKRFGGSHERKYNESELKKAS